QARSLDGSLGPNGRPRAGTLHREQQLDVAHHVLRPARFAGSPCFGPPRRAARGARRHVPRPAGGWQARSLDGSLGPNGRPRAGTLHREQQLDVAHHVLRPARFAGSPCFGPPRRAARGARRHVPRPAGGWQARSLDGSLGPNGRPRAGTLHREQQLDVAHHVLRPARFAGSPCFGPPRRAARGARRHVPRPAGGWQARSLDGSLGPNGRPRAGTLHREQQLDVAHHVLRPARFAGSPYFGPPRRAAWGARRHVPRPAGGWQARSLDGSLGPNGRPRAGTLHREQQLDVAHHVLRPARFTGSPCFGPPRRAARGARRHVPRPAGGWQARSLDGSLGPNGRPRAGTLHREQQLDVAHHVLRPARFAGSPCFGPPRRAARGARRHVPRPAGGWQARSLDGSLGPNGRPRAGTLHREQQLDVAHHVLRPARFAGSPCFGPPRRAARGARRHVPRPAGGWQARSLDGSLGPNGRPRAGTLHREQQLDVAHHVLRPARFAGSPCFGPPRRAARGARRHVPRPAGGWQARSLDGSLGPNGRPRAGTLHREQQLDVAHHVLRPARFAGSPCFGPPRRAARGARRHVPRPAGGVGRQARSLDGSLGPNGRPRAGTLHREQQLDVAHHVLRPARFAGSPCFGPPRRAARGARRHVPRPAGGWQARSLDGSLGPNGRPRAGTLHREQQLDVAHHVLRPARFAGSPCFGPPRRAARGARRHVPRPAGGWQARSLDGSLGPNGRPRAGTLHREQQLDVAHHVLRPARFAGSPCFGPPRRAARGARRHVPRPAGG
ncbi:hypothetical protein ACJX0J_001597, partial [Zea mays]